MLLHVYNFVLVRILRLDGSECDFHELGHIVAKLPLPPGIMMNLYKSTHRFLQVYFSRFPVSIKTPLGYNTSKIFHE